MMIGGLGLRRQAIDERDRLEEIRERELLLDRVALERPAVEALSRCSASARESFAIDLLCAWSMSYLRFRRARTSSSRTRAASTASSDSFCSSIALGPSVGLANALPAIVR